MICPKCKKKMDLVVKGFSYDFSKKPKDKFVRRKYFCKKDGIWIALEIPVSKKSQNNIEN